MNNDRKSNWNNRENKSYGGHRGGFRRGGDRQYRGVHKTFRGKNFGSARGGFSGYRGGTGPNSFGNRSNPQWNRPKRESPGKRLSEEEIGVTEYITDHEGFLGIIKSRYSDFQVSEINQSGEVAKLTDLSPPAPPEEETIAEDEDLILNKYNVEILPMETWDKINKLVVGEPTDEKVEIDVTGMSKEERTKIHEAVKKAFGDVLVGSTVAVDDKKYVKFERFRKGVRIDKRVKWVWPGEYVYFVVHKENCDTMEAAVKIAERLRLNIKPSMLGYAGTKDRRAKTSQWFSLRKVHPQKIAAACRDLREIHVGNYGFCANNLKLGALKGNKFRIALRNVTVPDETLHEACTNLKEKGFINYYGLQRFGSRVDNPTYDVGMKMLQGKFKEAIDCILDQREGPLQHALKLYKEEGPEAALRVWPRYAPNSAIEFRLVSALCKCPNDLLGAISKLARNTRLLYLHSYQSLVWNRAVSARLRRFGMAPAVGDLVPLSSVHDLEEIEEDSDTEEKETEDEPEPEPEPKPKTTESKEMKVPVKILTQTDIDNKTYSIFDIVLPLPGYNIEYPPNMVDLYRELLDKDGLSLEMKHKIKSYSMSGAYRHMAVRPLDVEWRSVRYTDPYADLILSDLDEMEERELDGILEDGKYKALLLTMSLPASCYATMALRELLKIDTSSDNQALQNNYFKKKDLKEETEEEKTSGEGQTDSGDTKVKDTSESVEESSRSENGENVTLGKGDSGNGDECDRIESGKRKLDDESGQDAKKLKEE